MKKMKLTRSLMAACSIVALSAVMYGCVHDGGGDEPEPMVEPMPEPEPEPDPEPTDLEVTQGEARTAADAAMTASTNAAESASSAADATATLATLQTGADSNADEMGGNEAAMAAQEAADEAAEAADDAADAAAEAEAATAGTDAEAALRKALDAQDAAEAAEATAAEMAEAAIAAAMTELHIDGTMKSVGDSSVDADADTTTSPTGDRITGFIRNVERAMGAVMGQEYDEDAATPTPYIQAVAARDLEIGKVVDTSDDMARLALFHSTDTTEMVRVYGIPVTRTTIVVRTNADGDRTSADSIANIAASTTVAPEFKSLGMHIEASNPITDATTTPVTRTAADDLVHTDVVEAETEPKEVFSYTEDTGTITVVETSRTVDSVTGNTDVTYMSVDTLAPAAPDAHGLADDMVDTLPDEDENPESIPVRASIPVAKAYSHIHFGLWASLGAADTDGSQMLADLGIGFVQNISGSGMTDRLGIGTVMYEGDWVAAVQRQNTTAGAGAITLDNGPATLMADFDEGEFTGTLTNLATLKGTLDGNGFSGMTASAISHADLDADGDFDGEFSGGIYGPAGTEAAGVFDFDGGEAGAFRGAFGGTNQD